MSPHRRKPDALEPSRFSRRELLTIVLFLAASALMGARDSAAADQPSPATTGNVRLPAGLFEAGESHRVIEVMDGQTLRLDNGEQLRLVGVLAPTPPVGRGSDRSWPLAREARTFLETLVLDQSVILAFGEGRIDRHGRILAHASDGSGRWLQGELLRRGLARVASYPDNRTGVEPMLRLERAARAEQRGLWGHPFFAIRRHQDAEQDIGRFALVEGRVLEVAVIAGRAYLNFGEDWRSDFTLVIDPAERRQFEAEGFDPDYYAGRLVRVRGWLGYRNGATINVTHPEQIEVLDK